MALIAAHLNAGVNQVLTVTEAIYIYINSLSPTSTPPSPTFYPSLIT